MRIRISILALSVVLPIPALCGAQDGSIQQAQNAAQAWLTLTDSGQYAPSWYSAAALFQAAVTKAAWIRAITSARSPLGGLKSRKLKSATFTHNLPGAPEGEYVVIQYDTQFDNKATAIETITPMHEKDGSWKVSGYFIK